MERYDRRDNRTLEVPATRTSERYVDTRRDATRDTRDVGRRDVAPSTRDRDERRVEDRGHTGNARYDR